MLRSFLMGLVAGQRGLTPLAAIAIGTHRRALPAALPLQSLFLNPFIVTGTVALATAELIGDKMETAPDRIVPIGLAVRSVTAAYAGAALAPPEERKLAVAVATVTALASSYVGWRLRCAAMKRYGQTTTGLVEDAIVLGSGVVIADLVTAKELIFRRKPTKSGIRTLAG